ncbi:MAG: hypothetical protein JW736_10845 [Deltaproteobacteria bacterium]|nr:hypothetical protein [Deltaproteobacteria bacterium]
MDRNGWVIIGLILDLVGVLLLAWDLLISKKRALELGLPHYAGQSDEDNLKHPAVRNLLRQAKHAKIGVVLISLGFLLQLIGNLI